MTDVVRAETTIRPISPEQHDDVMHYFDLVAYADNPSWSRCYCMFPLAADHESRTRDENRASRSELIKGGHANGLVAYRLGRVVGWCHAAPKREILRVPEPRDERTGAIVCFVVAPDARRQGVASDLLDAALEHLAARGMREVEAYPLAEDAAMSAGWAQANYLGPLAMYLRAGFTKARRDGGTYVVRKSL